jgi:spore maturation protein CgeB
MRILTVEPGPAFSVADVHSGWLKAFQALGTEVRNFNLSDRLSFVEASLRDKVPEEERGRIAARMVAEQLRAACFDFWPDLVVITSAFFIPPETYDTIRNRGIRIAVLLTESPYEDPFQLGIAARADMAILNDPINLDTYRAVQPNTWYIPHAYDPEKHRRRPPVADLVSDFAWVGTAYPSRVQWFEDINLDGLEVVLGGNWQQLPATSPLHRHLLHDSANCLDNQETVDVYSSTRASVNLYRTESETGFQQGWAMGPREIELAATETFFLRDPRPESDDILRALPSFTSPGDFSEKLRWWLAHDEQRLDAIRAAKAAISGRTFLNNAKSLLGRVETLN